MGTIEQKVDYLKETKQAIRAAIEEKGVSVADTDSFRSYASKIGTISGGGGGTKWYVGDFYSGQMYEGNNGDLFLNTGQTDRGLVLQFQDGTWNPVGSILGPQGENGVDGTDGSIAPVGSIVIWGSENIPENYLKCEGQTLSREEYASLFNVIGTTFGDGDGTTTFALPDMRNYVVVGMSDDTDINAIGKKYGEKEVTLTVEQIPPHNHSLTAHGSDGTGNMVSQSIGNGGSRVVASWVIGNTGGGQPHNNMQPSMAMVFIIKAYEITPANVNVVDSLDGNSATDAPSVHAVNTKLESLALERNIATFRLEDDTYALTDGVEATLPIHVSYNIGTKISLSSDGYIRVPDDVSYVLISGMVDVAVDADGDYAGRVDIDSDNGWLMTTGQCSMSSKAGRRIHISFSPVIIETGAIKKFRPKVTLTGGNGTIQHGANGRCNFTVEVIN